MLEIFFRTHQFLLEHTEALVRRALMDEIDWRARLIGIKGSRGVGKTTFLLQYARENFGTRDRRCLYINMNNFYFQGTSLFNFACEFQKVGGQVLLIDQVFKDPDWSHQLRMIYDRCPRLHVVFTGSSGIVMSASRRKSWRKSIRWIISRAIFIMDIIPSSWRRLISPRIY